MDDQKVVETLQKVTLNNGVEMPILGFGVYQVTNAEICGKNVYQALTQGII
jgi:2,5-diketo-D-gluconate reductase A